MRGLHSGLVGVAALFALAGCEEVDGLLGGEDAQVGPVTDAGAPAPGVGWSGGGVTCQSQDNGPCSAFVTAQGKTIPLGPYGAVVERNVGKGFENEVAIGDSLPGVCDVFATTFGENESETEKLLDVTGLDFALYTVYRPASWTPGEKFPILTWGNGTCAQPEGYGALLRYIASHGFFIVAANNRWVGGATEMLRGVDFALQANGDPTSPYYQKLDPARVGAMGHSQGGLGTSNAADDSRVQAAILFNGGTSASKPFLAFSGDMDISGQDSGSFASAVLQAPEAAYIFYHMVPATGNFSGHLTLMMQPERVVDAAAAWWKYMFKNDPASRALFVGPSCGLCGHAAEYEFGAVGLN
jgi:hypothetical protein